MTFFINQVFEIEYPPEAAIWCNDRGDCYIDELDKKQDGTRVFQIKAIPEPTTEEKQETVRRVRDSYLREFVDPVVTNPLRWEDLSESEQTEIKDYRRYLLDYTESNETWYEQYPMTFDVWIESKQV